MASYRQIRINNLEKCIMALEGEKIKIGEISASSYMRLNNLPFTLEECKGKAQKRMYLICSEAIESCANRMKKIDSKLELYRELLKMEKAETMGEITYPKLDGTIGKAKV